MNTLPNIAHEFRHMRIPLPKVDEAHSAFDRLREARRAAMNDNRRSPTEAGCVTIFAKSHAGKTTIINWYMEKNPTADEHKKVVVVTLNGESTQSAFLSQVLNSTLYKIPREFGFVGGADMRRPARIVRSAVSFSII